MKARVFSGMMIALAALVSGSLQAWAEEADLSGSQILEVLSGRTALYDDGAKQFFHANGSTLYISAKGVNEQGSWRVEGDRYCSHWGRSWDCYDMTGQGGRVSWLTTWGKDYKARMVEGNRL